MKLYPGIYGLDSLLSKRFQRPGKLDKYIRHDFRIWEAKTERDARLKDENGKIMLGDEVLADWRKRTARGAARMRAYYDVIPGADSVLTQDSRLRNEWGDPLPRIQMADSSESQSLRDDTENQIRSLFEDVVKAGGGKMLSMRPDRTQDHPGGGCRMGKDPATSVVDSLGRSHDHENLWIAGAPTVVSGGCCNGTLTFSALSLRSASAIEKELTARPEG